MLLVYEVEFCIYMFIVGWGYLGGYGDEYFKRLKVNWDDFLINELIDLFKFL